MSSEIRIVPVASHESVWRRLIRSQAAMAVLSPALLLALWEIAGRLGWLDQRVSPPPWSTAVDLTSLLGSGELLGHLGWTVERVAIGFCLGAIPAVLLGLAMGLSPALMAIFRPIVAAIYPIPKIALFPLIMLMFGLGETSKWVIVAIGVFFQVFFAALAGVANIDRIYLDVARNFGATRWQAYRLIAMPAALPFIFTGCPLGGGMALIAAVVAEQYGTKVGLGYMIWRSWQVFEVRDMFVGLMMVALLGYGIQLAMGALEGWVIRWKPRAGARTKSPV